MFHIRRKDNQNIVANFYELERAMHAYETLSNDVYELIDDKGNVIEVEKNETSV